MVVRMVVEGYPPDESLNGTKPLSKHPYRYRRRHLFHNSVNDLYAYNTSILVIITIYFNLLPKLVDSWVLHQKPNGCESKNNNSGKF